MLHWHLSAAEGEHHHAQDIEGVTILREVAAAVELVIASNKLVEVTDFAKGTDVGDAEGGGTTEEGFFGKVELDPGDEFSPAVGEAVVEDVGVLANGSGLAAVAFEDGEGFFGFAILG